MTTRVSRHSPVTDQYGMTETDRKFWRDIHGRDYEPPAPPAPPADVETVDAIMVAVVRNPERYAPLLRRALSGEPSPNGLAAPASDVAFADSVVSRIVQAAERYAPLLRRVLAYDPAVDEPGTRTADTRADDLMVVLASDPARYTAAIRPVLGAGGAKC